MLKGLLQEALTRHDSTSIRCGLLQNIAGEAFRKDGAGRRPAPSRAYLRSAVAVLFAVTVTLVREVKFSESLVDGSSVAPSQVNATV